MTDYILDTNAVSAILDKKGRVAEKLQGAVFRGNSAYISGLTLYEVKRGLLAENLRDKLDQLDSICRKFAVVVALLDSEPIFDAAAGIWADLRKTGTPLDADADILIAATAVTRRMVVVSDDSDFHTIRGVTRQTVENWF